MDVAREDRIELLFEEALALESAERSSFLDQACVGDPALRSELDELLRNAAGARDFAGRVQGAIVARWADYVLAGSAPRRDTSRRRRLYRVGGAAGLAIVVGAGVLLGVSRSRSRVDRSIRSVAVLPVAEVSPDSVRQPLSDEMMTLLIDRIARVGGVRVTPRSSVVAYEASRKSSREIGRELGVDALVQVSIFRDDTRARVTVSLISASAEHVAWSQTFGGSLGDAPSLEREVAETVAGEVGRRAR
jgi:TolB-like protein